MNTQPAPLSSSSKRFSAIAVRQAPAVEEPTRSSASALGSLAQLEAGLIRLVGGEATAALVERSRHLCSQGKTAGATPSSTLIRLATTLLGESLASRLIHLGQPAQEEPAADPSSHH